jgi:hypothetical protein
MFELNKRLINYFLTRLSRSRAGLFLVCLVAKLLPMLRSILLAFCLLFYFVSQSQSPVILPGNTGYASPAETKEMFQAGGVQNWTDAKQQLSYYFYARKAGDLSIGLNLKNGVTGGSLQVAVAGQKFLVRVPASKTFKSVGAGTVHLADSGFYTITISALKKSGPGDRRYPIPFSLRSAGGQPAFQCEVQEKCRVGSPEVPARGFCKSNSFYNEITVPAGFDPVHTYYMACGFARGYFGIQVNSNTERRVIFSVWDAGKEAADRSKVADSNKVQLLAKGADVFADGFGNEGTGGHSHWVYPWKTGQTYRFLVTALADSASQTTIYTGFFFVPEVQRWKLIASFRAPFDGKNLRSLYSFNENFDGSNGQLQRKALFSNQWVQRRMVHGLN